MTGKQWAMIAALAGIVSALATYMAVRDGG
jgi:hypothetical protein